MFHELARMNVAATGGRVAPWYAAHLELGGMRGVLLAGSVDGR
jgi:hypothetical protein